MNGRPWILILVIWASLGGAMGTARADRPAGYNARPCGFDMDRNGIIGEPADRLVGDGVTADPDGDGVNEDMLYVDSAAGNDSTGDGSPAKPYRTVQKALNVADGPGDGAEDIICIAGTFEETLTIQDSGVSGYYVRDDFQFPANPLMVIGWDKDGDGQYPPYDTDDIAVLDGNTDGSALAWAVTVSGKRSYLEIAHLTIKRYGYKSDSCGAFKLFPSGTGSQTHIYVHDVEMYDINKAQPDASGKIVISWWGGARSHVAIINSLCDDYASYFCRGSPYYCGNWRFQNLTLNMYGTYNQWTTGWKIWGPNNNTEILDCIIDSQPDQWNPDGEVSGILIAQCSQDWTVRGNELRNVGITLQAHAGSYCTIRNVDDIVIDRNIIKQTYGKWTWPQIGIAMGNCDNLTNTVEDVTITNNFIWSNTSQSYEAGIWPNMGNNEGPQPGTVTIVGNTFYGRCTRNGWGAVVIDYGYRSYAYKQNNITFKNNIINNLGPNPNVRTTYVPSNWIANGNVYSASRGWVWNGTNYSTLSAWRAATGQDVNSKTGDPVFVDIASGDLHLDPSDTVARGAGVDITDITMWDIDGDLRDPNNPTAGADTEGAPPDTEPPTIAAWYSAGEHGHGVGEALLPVGPTGFSEPRSGGIRKLLVHFSEAMDPVSFGPAAIRIAGRDANNLAVDLSSVGIQASLQDGDTVGEIAFTPALPDFARYVVRISGATDVAGNPLVGGERIITALCGDVSSDLRVNATDLSVARVSRTRLIDPGSVVEVRADVSADGRVNASDLSRIRARRPNDARWIADPVLTP